MASFMNTITTPTARNPKTRAPFKPKSSSRGSSSYQLRQYAEQTLGSGSLKKVVKLPEGEDIDEWLAVNGVHFPKNFQTTVRQLVKRLFRVYAHIYCHHYPVIVALGLDPHMNTSFKHYVLFIKEFDLESGKDFYGPLSDMVETILRTDN
ncbi:Mitotic exit network component [Maublancomyces gigas]|uniref:Mitotic exit network component n=1 Tax=Discina gigas TaxID=1032678 RepID=A0ABR3GP14_9PEZI